MGLALETAVPADGSYSREEPEDVDDCAVFVGGALGALSRYGLDRLIEQRGESTFPWSTFAIKVSGCVLVGFLIATACALVWSSGSVAATRLSRRSRGRRSTSSPRARLR